MEEIILTALDDSYDDDGEFNLEGSGHVSATLFMNALQVWHWAQNRVDVAVEEAAVAFNTTTDVIRQAINMHPWMLEVDGVIEAEGE